MRWTGNGVADGTAVSAANVNTAGNGDTVAYATSGTVTAVYGEGIEITAAAGGIARLDLTLPTAGKFARGQVFFRPGAAAVAAAENLLLFRGTGGTNVAVLLTTTGRLILANAANVQPAATQSPVLTMGTLYQIDLVCALDATAPSATNGRAFYRVRAIGDTAWNGGADFFYDSGYTFNAGTADMNVARVGRVSNPSGAMTVPSKWSSIGWDSQTINTSTDPGVTQSQFMAPPGANSAPTASAGVNRTVAVGSPITVTGTSSDSDGTIVSRSWTFTSLPPGVTAPSLTGATTESVTFTPSTAGRYVLSYTVTDDGGLTASASVKVFVPGLSVNVIEVTANTGGWTNAGGAANFSAALSDSNDATQAQSPTASGFSAPLRLRLAPLVSPTTFSLNLRSVLSQSGGGAASVALYEGTTLRKTWAVSPTTVLGDLTLTLTSAEIATITSWNELDVELNWV